MIDDPQTGTSSGDPAASTPAPAEPSGRERRRNHALRELVDEMLASIRTAVNRDLWTADERAQYEQELAQIMARVRSGAMHRDTTTGNGQPH